MKRAVFAYFQRFAIRRDAARAFRYDKAQFMENAGALHLDRMAAARAEYLEKTGDTTPVDSDKTMARPSGRSYRLDGTPATAQTRGIVIQDNRKTLRK